MQGQKMTDFYRKYISVPSVFNNDTLLEFSLDPDKRCLVLGESYLQFYVELPANFVPDNNFGNKCFEYVGQLNSVSLFGGTKGIYCITAVERFAALPAPLRTSIDFHERGRSCLTGFVL